DVLIDSSVLWRNGEFMHTRCLTRDITGRRQAERDVQSLNETLGLRVEELETILEVAPIAMAVAHNPEATRITLNPAGRELFGPPEALPVTTIEGGVTGCPFRIYRDGVEVRAGEGPLRQAARTNSVIDGEEIELVRRDGTHATLLQYVSPLHDA